MELLSIILNIIGDIRDALWSAEYTIQHITGIVVAVLLGLFFLFVLVVSLVSGT